jgi:Protein of unknown function (DUF2971).
MKLYHYTSLNAFQKIWEEKRLKFCESKTTNDSFERNKSLRINSNFISDCLNSISEEQIKEFIYDVLSEIEDYRQVSLCVDYDNNLKGYASPMMWGQYARKKNTRNKWVDGVCLEIEESKLMWPSDNFYKGKVSYTNDVPLPILDGIDITKDDAISSYIDKNQSLLFFTKHIHWEHENEYRLVCKGQDYIDISKAITGIYVLEKGSPAFKKVTKLVDNESLVNYLSIGSFVGRYLAPTNLKHFNDLHRFISKRKIIPENYI